MSKAPDKQNHNPAFIGYPKSTIVLATLLLGALYTIATADKTSKQIQVVCAIIAAVTVMVIISSFVAIFCNRNNKEDVASVSTQTNFAERGTQTDDTQKSVVNMSIQTETDVIQENVVGLNSNTIVPSQKPLLQPLPANVILPPPPPPPEPTPAQLNNGYKPNAQPVVADAQKQNANVGNRNALLEQIKAGVKLKPAAKKSTAEPDARGMDSVLAKIREGVQLKKVASVKPAPKAADAQHEGAQKIVPAAPPKPPIISQKPQGDNKQNAQQQATTTQPVKMDTLNAKVLGRRVFMSDSQSSTLIESMQDSTVDSHGDPTASPNTSQKPQASNQNNAPDAEQGAQVADAQQSAQANNVNPIAVDIINRALFKQVGSIMTESFTNAANQEKMNDSQCSTDSTTWTIS